MKMQKPRTYVDNERATQGPNGWGYHNVAVPINQLALEKQKGKVTSRKYKHIMVGHRVDSMHTHMD